jgi:serine/threonine protein kinase
LAAEVINTRYEIIETIVPSDGGAIATYKARDIREGRVVALTVVPALAASVVPDLALRLREAAAKLTSLSSPSISRITSVENDDPSGDIVLVGDYLRGITLRERIRRVAPFSQGVATDIAIAICEALVAAHAAGVTHGHLTPDNVILSPEGEIKVGGFQTSGLLSLVAPDGDTPYQERGAPSVPSPSSDIYSLGAMLFEMLTGKSPQPAGAPPISPRSLNSAIPLALDGVTLKALQPSTGARYGAASKMLADLVLIRDAIKAGKPLTWSPLDDKKPAAAGFSFSPRQAAVAPAASGLLEEAAEELDEERMRKVEREPASALSVALWVLFAVVILGVLGLVWSAKNFLNVPSDVNVPSLIGKTVDDAKVLATQQKFTLVEGGADFSTKWPENQIYSQSPVAGTMIKENKTVTFYRSKGPRLLTVPDLVGLTQERAVRALREASLPAGTVAEQFSETVAAGVVISQTPEAGGNAPRYTAVNYIVSKGKQPPDLIGNLQANPTGPTTVDVTWNKAARATSYTVSRVDDGTLKVIAQGLTDTKYTDTGLSPDTSYSYLVNAINSVGESGQSETALAITPPKVETPPVMGNVDVAPADSNGATDVTPPDANPSDTTAGSDPSPARMRQFTLAFRMPRRPRGSRHVQFEVQDATGTTLVYDETHSAGDRISAPVTAFGNKIIFRVFIDGKLVKQQTL